MAEERDLSSEIRGGPAGVIEQVMKVAQVVGRYGLTTVIFAFPVVLGCYGLYFLWLAASAPQANMAQVIVGIFATIFGPGLTILLLYVFTRWNLWERLRVKEGSKNHPKTT